MISSVYSKELKKYVIGSNDDAQLDQFITKSTNKQKLAKSVKGSPTDVANTICDNLGVPRGSITITVPDGSPPIHFKIKAQSTCICGVVAKSACVRCRSKRYCSKECQAADWKCHKKHCQEADISAAKK